MAREKEYLYAIETKAKNGRTIMPRIAYRPDRTRPWTVDIDWTEMSPTYRDIGHAQAFLRRHYGSENNPNFLAARLIPKSALFSQLQVLPCDQ